MADVGIVCVSRENQSAPWLNFEAGALAKNLESSRVVPLIINLKPSEVQQPLAQFQAKEATKAGILDVLRLLDGLPRTRCQTLRWRAIFGSPSLSLPLNGRLQLQARSQLLISTR